jgi:hypothetical protein
MGQPSLFPFPRSGLWRPFPAILSTGCGKVSEDRTSDPAAALARQPSKKPLHFQWRDFFAVGPEQFAMF